MISLNYRDSRPIYEQIRDELRKLALSGGLNPGDKLPSVRELASSLSINPNTIQRAYRELEAEGYIYSVAGKGSFVAPLSAVGDKRRQELLEKFSEAAEELRAIGAGRDELSARLEEVYKK
ncbi:MAG: GntR family transcriptional regulator [Oscillospiraceae bacterium]|jgi:GntR family transcriptional regulator